MNIDIYSKYKVRFLNSGAYISQEDSTPDDIVFTHYEDDKEEIIEIIEYVGMGVYHKIPADEKFKHLK